jgi:WD40 repeat protein
MSVLLCTAGYDHTIKFWEAPSGHPTETLQFTDSQVNRLVISPDRRYIAAAGNPIVRLYDVNSKAAVTFSLLSLCFSCFGAYLKCFCSCVILKDIRVMLLVWDFKRIAIGCIRLQKTTLLRFGI